MLEQQLIAASKIVEEHVDTELERMTKLDEENLEEMRKMRIAEMKQKSQQKQEWLLAGHGEYSEITEEREFFSASKRSQRLIVHFYVNSSENCKIIDKHLTILTPKHLGTRFCKINAEKTPFLVGKLKIKLMPTLVLILDGQIVGQIRGFDPLGGRQDFHTSVLESRLAEFDLLSRLTEAPPTGQAASSKKSILGLKSKSKNSKSIRDGKNAGRGDSDSDVDDW